MQPLSVGVLVVVLTSMSALWEGVLVCPTAEASTPTPRQSDGERVCVVLVVASTSASPKSDGEPVVVLVV